LTRHIWTWLICLFASTCFGDLVTVCRTGLYKPILNHTTTLDTIVLSLPPNSRILDVNIRIDTVFHEFDEDLRFYLRHLNTGVLFIDRVGGGGNNFIATNINDSASCYIGQSGFCNTAPFSGTFRPTNPATLLPFNYEAASGLWILAITDTMLQDEGVLKAWCITIVYDDLLSAESNTNSLPSGFVLYQNYPNPFNSRTVIKFDVPYANHVRLYITDILGTEVSTLLNTGLSAGSYKIQWDACAFPSGVYFYRLETPYRIFTKKMTVIK
jgi:hypothetical protein